jgi:hypothetical protein
MTPVKSVTAIVFVIDQGFGSLRLPEGDEGEELAGIDLRPGAAEALDTALERRLRTAVAVTEPLSSRSAEVLTRFLPSIDQVVTLDQSVAETLVRLTRDWSTDPTTTLVVAADRVVRGAAAERGMLAVAHPTLATLVLRGRTLRFVLAAGHREEFERPAELIPYWLERHTDNAWQILAVMSESAIAEALRRRSRIHVLPLDLATEDPLLIQLDEVDGQAAEALSRHNLLWSDDVRALLAIGAAQSTDALPVHGSHGHFRLLTPSPELLRPTPQPTTAARATEFAVARLPLDRIEVTRLPADLEDLQTVLSSCPSTAASFMADVDRYSGAAPLDASGPIASRHIRHPDNPRVVQALLTDLRAMGLCAYTHTFAHAGRTLRNVVADLPGRGLFRLDPSILEPIREILVDAPLPEPPDPWLEAVSQSLGHDWVRAQMDDAPAPLAARRKLETSLGLRPWYPWWLRACPLAGPGAEIVIMGCHLDSTAMLTSGYDPATDAAPGADDDASGIAATLAVARWLRNLRGRLTHTVRFCFFNAEEAEMVGSRAYASMLRDADAPVRAVICADMIGYNSDAQGLFEVHAGFTDPAVRDLSTPIADKIAAWTATLNMLPAAQIYKGTIPLLNPDRNLYDGAIGRSDHVSFHERGYPAVVVSEDFFANLPTEPGSDPNPSYHRTDDRVIDSDYAANITCAIAYAVKELAG